MNFKFDFENFKVHVCNFPENAEIDTGKVVEYDAAGGLFAGRGISKTGWTEIRGTVREELKAIEVLSLNELCTVIDEKNYAEYENYETEYGPLDVWSTMADCKKGEKLEILSTYIFDGIEDLEEYDAVAASLLSKCVMADGREVWYLIYQPSVVEGKYVLASRYKELVE